MPMLILLSALYLGGGLATLAIGLKHSPPCHAFDYLFLTVVIILWPVLWVSLALWMIITDINQ